MQLNLLSPLNPHDWAFWLHSIALHPHQHETLAVVEDQVQYLDEQEQRRKGQEGVVVHKLTMDKMIEITQRMWGNPRTLRTQKRQMLEGLRYIHRQRQARYENLFWLTRVIAKWRGVEIRLKVEREEIDRLQTELAAPPTLPKGIKVVRQDERIHASIVSLEEELKKLLDRKDQLQGDEKGEGYESCFILEKKLFHFRENLSADQFSHFKPQLKELNKILNERNPEIPRFKDIVKTFGHPAIKQSLQKTLSSLCADKNITQAEQERDQALFQCSSLEAEALYVKRLIKAENTKLSLSLVTAIERTWQEIKQNGEQEAKTKIVEGKRVIFIPEDGEIYLKEDYISEGTYKASFVITPFHAMKKSQDRGTLVILQAIKGNILEEIEEYNQEKSPKQGSRNILPSSRKQQSHKQQSKDSGSVNGTTIINETPQDYVSKSGSSEFDDEEYQSYKKEADNCLLYGKLPGVWPTHKVTTVDKHIAIIQPLAGYQLKMKSGQEIKAITIEDMCYLLNNDLLEAKDQLAFLKMMSFALMGIESLHNRGAIHRDLKSANILCSNQKLAAVTDLGNLCTNMVNIRSQQVDNPQKRRIVGTPCYIAPELPCYHFHYLKWKSINMALDIWATGLILWEAFSGKPLAKHPIHLTVGNVLNIEPVKIVELIGEVLSNKKKKGNLYNMRYSEPKEKTSLAHLVWCCTRADPSQRPCISEVIERYEAWVNYTETKMNARKIQSIRETFEDAVS